MRLWIVEPDREFREELHNFLLSAGYGSVGLSEDAEGPRPDTASDIDAVILGAASPAASRPVVEQLRRRHPATRLIVLIEVDDPNDDNGWKSGLEAVYFLIKSTYSRQLPYFLGGR